MKQTSKVLNYRVIVEPDERTGTNDPCFFVYCPKLDIADEGDTVEQALGNIQEAIELYVETLTESGEEVPLEKSGTMFTSVSIPLRGTTGGSSYNFV